MGFFFGGLGFEVAVQLPKKQGDKGAAGDDEEGLPQFLPGWFGCGSGGVGRAVFVFRLPLGLRGGLPAQHGLLGDAESFLLLYPAVVFGALFGVGEDCVGAVDELHDAAGIFAGV